MQWRASANELAWNEWNGAGLTQCIMIEGIPLTPVPLPMGEGTLHNRCNGVPSPMGRGTG